MKRIWTSALSVVAAFALSACNFFSLEDTQLQRLSALGAKTICPLSHDQLYAVERDGVPIARIRLFHASNGADGWDKSTCNLKSLVIEDDQVGGINSEIRFITDAVYFWTGDAYLAFGREDPDQSYWSAYLTRRYEDGEVDLSYFCQAAEGIDEAEFNAALSRSGGVTVSSSPFARPVCVVTTAEQAIALAKNYDVFAAQYRFMARDG
jgi:hypothetical protein